MKELNLEEKKSKYYKLRYKLDILQHEMLSIEKFRGNTSAFKGLLTSIDLLRDQVQEDFDRYENCITRSKQRDEMAAMQQSLNRERLKRAELEKKITEAKVDSSLFIKYVKEKIGF